MAAKKKTTKKEEEIVTSTGEVKEKVIESVPAPEEKTEKTKPVVEATEKKAPASVAETKKTEKELKYPIGSIVYVSKNAESDLEGFKLFPQYKKYTYTVEAYDAISGVYTLRRLNLSLKLKEADIVSPDERAHDQINRMQF